MKTTSAPKHSAPRLVAVLALLGSSCSGDEAAPSPAAAGGADAGATGGTEASVGGKSGSTSSGGRAGMVFEAGSSGGGAGTGGRAGSGGSVAPAGGAGGTSGASASDAGTSTGGATGPEGGPADGGLETSVDGAREAEAATCLAPRTACPSGCADLSNDANNCGTCSHACAALEACVNGSCTSAHCGSALVFDVEAERLLVPMSGDGGVTDGGSASGAFVSPNRVVLVPGGSGALDAWIAASDGVYQALGGGTTLLTNPVSVFAGPSQSIAVTKLASDAGNALAALVDDTLTDVELVLGAAGGAYSVAGTIPIGDHEGSILSVDIDGDGRNEIVVAALVIADNSISLSIYKVPPIGQPALWRSRVVALGGSLDVYGVAAGSFDHDGYEDIALAAYGSTPALITFQNTPSDLSDPVIHALPGGRVRSPLVADFDRDGFDDVVAVAGQSIHFFAGSGGGLARDPLTTTPEHTYSYADAAAGDFDRDGKIDLMLVRRIPPTGTQLVPAWGDAQGAFIPDFTQAISLPAVSGITAGDIDADTRPDVAVISADRGSLTPIKNACN